MVTRPHSGTDWTCFLQSSSCDYLWRRHVDQLLESKSSEPDSPNVSVSESATVTRPPEIPISSSVSNTPVDTDTSESVPSVEQSIRRSSRQRKAPDRLIEQSHI